VIETLQSPSAGTKTGELSVIQPTRLNYPFSRYVIRAEAGQLDRVLKDAREAVSKTAPTAVFTSTRTVTEDRFNRYRNDRAMAWMLVTISGLLLLVTVSGIVGITALRVAQRRKQIGVRRALGPAGAISFGTSSWRTSSSPPAASWRASCSPWA
jgi:putative ABC transport system permease protein